MFKVVKQATVLYKDPVQEHLYIIITNPCGPKDEVLMTPVCTVKTTTKKREKICLLTKENHEFIMHASYIAYSMCRTEEASIVTERVNSGLFVDMGKLDAIVFARVVAGFSVSKRVAPYYRKFLLDANKE